MILSSFNFPIKISYYEIYFFLMALGNSTTYSVDKVSLCHKQLQKNLLSLSLWCQRNHKAAGAHLYPLLSVDLHTIGT